MKNLLVCGYRANELNIFNQKHKGIPYIKMAIEARLAPLIDEGLEWVLTAGQYGFDLWVCEVANELRLRYPQLKTSILAAYKSPEEKWSEEKQTYFRDIAKAVDYYGSVSNQPYSGVWQLRNRDDLLFRKSDGMLLFYDEDAGEASPKHMKARAMKRQQADGYPIYTITAEDVQSISDEQGRE